MMFCFNDGGRKEAGFKGTTGDCGVRAIAIALVLPYREVYDALAEIHAVCGKRTAREGLWREEMSAFLAPRGWLWTPTMQVGSGCTVRMHSDSLPKPVGGRMILRLSKHYCAVVHGAIMDLSDCSRNGTRCVYGYWSRA